jgi:hypothetical protein
MWDNKAKRGHFERYSEIDPTTKEADVPKYFWWAPAAPWDEDYDVAIGSRDGQLHQKLLIKRINRSLRVTTSVEVPGKGILIDCKDVLAGNVDLRKGRVDDCSQLLTIGPEIQGKVEPHPDSLEKPDGTVVLFKIRTEPVPLAPELKPQAPRKLTDWQEKKLVFALSSAPPQKLLMLVASGAETHAFAKNLSRLFESKLHWKVRSVAIPESVWVTDLQVSTGGPLPPPDQAPPAGAADFQKALVAAGLKCRSQLVFDTDLKPGVIALWVGIRSPDEHRPDDYMPNSAARLSLSPGLKLQQ